MTKIRIHRYENPQWGRAHLPFLKSFDAYLNNFFDVEVKNYNIDGQTFTGSIELQYDVPNFGKNPPLSDVDCVIENLDNGELKVLSFTEYFNSYICHTIKSPKCTGALISHFNWHNIYYWMKKEYAIEELYKVKPWIFLPYLNFDYEYYRNLRDNSENLEEKIFWLGSGVGDYRKVIEVINDRGILQPLNSLPHEEYLKRLSNSKIALGYYTDLSRYNTPYDHPGEFCYRDIEYAIMGVPFIRIEYKDTLHNPLLPNHHYISIPREHAYVAYEKNGDIGVAELYIEKYWEIKDDNFFLNYVSNNLREWSNNNILNGSAEKLTYDLLNLNLWKI
jgi:hypothetical protein